MPPPDDKDTDLPEGIVPSEEQWQQADEDFSINVLIRGQDRGQLFWAYLEVPPSRLSALNEAEKQGELVLAEYGKVIAMGYGKEPPDKVKAEMEEKYGMQHDFEEQVERRIGEMQEREKVVGKYSGKKEVPENNDKPSEED